MTSLKVVVQSNPTHEDWFHNVKCYKEEFPSNYDSDFVCKFETTIKGNIEDEKIVYVLFHFHDNYIDIPIEVFGNFQDGYEKFTNVVHEEIKRFKDNKEESLCIKNFKDSWDMTLRDQKGYYPDKGNRWRLTKVYI